MDKIKKGVFILIVLFVLISIFYFEFKDNRVSDISVNKGELTLKEAVTIGLDRAKEWNKNASLLSVTSVDETMGGTRGSKGKRFKWTIFFMAPGTEKQLLVGISNGIITDVEEITGAKNPPTMKLNDIKFDSPDLLHIAKNKYGLHPGEDWATGYHFLLSITDDKPTATVVGIDKNKLYTMIYLDPHNGKVSSAMHKVPIGGGLIAVQQESNLSKITKNGNAVLGITVGENSMVTWGDRKPREFNATIQPFLEMSYNDGESWSGLDIKDYITNAWFNSQNELYVSTVSEVFSYVKSGSEVNKILSLEGEIEYLDYSTNNNIAILSNKMIYTTENQGDEWEKTTVPETTRSIQVSDEGDLFIFTQDRKILRKEREKWNIIEIPTSEEEPLDIKVIKNKLVVTTESGLWTNEFKGNSWSKIQTNNPISRLIKKGSKLLGITEGGTTYLINLGGGDANVRLDKLFESKDRIVLDLDVTEKELFVATTPNYVWEQIDITNK